VKHLLSSVVLLGFVLALVLAPTHVLAQRTGDGIVPAIEMVCDGDPFSFGLCNAYCEALDCDSATPLGTPRACANKLKNYLKKSGGAFPPCENSCPCSFDSAQLEADKTEFESLTDPESESTECGAVGPDGEPGFHYNGEQDGGEIFGDIYYYIGAQGATCNRLGEETDVGTTDELFSSSNAITPEEGEACLRDLEKLCPDP